MTQKNTVKMDNKKLTHLLWVSRIILISLLLIALYKGCATPSYASSKNVYEVEVRIRIGSSYSNQKVIVEASSSSEAQRIAFIQVRYQIKMSVTRCKQLN